ncbi:MAG: hypothetical protein LQ343_004284 [Gyalolechia ehrenbergii]|nr:MAG: hypothetical protein LQ343_004284 [Gyalolechia ehrenbergii]
MHPLSESQIYALAEQARAKLVGQWSAKDNNLRQIISHARLYDDLVICVEETRAKRKRRNSTEHSLVRKAAFSTDKKDESNLKARQPPESRSVDSREDASCAGTDGTTECTITEEDVVDSSTENINHANSPKVSPSRFRQDDNPSDKAHASPAIVKSPATFEMINMPRDRVGASQITVSELAIDDDSDSDSDYDSDSNSDFDAERDAAAAQNGNTDTPIITLKSNDSFPHSVFNNEADFAPSFPTSTPNLPSNDTPRTLERSSPAATTQGQCNSRADNGPLAPVRVFPKTFPLPPRLCVEGTHAASNLERDYLFRQALRELPASCKKRISTQNAVLRWLSTFASWSPSVESCMNDDEPQNEKTL